MHERLELYRGIIWPSKYTKNKKEHGDGFSV